MCCFFNGQCIQNDVFYAQEIVRYWNEIIMSGYGHHHNGNLKKIQKGYDCSPLGVIDYHDTEAIEQLKEIVAYLCKYEKWEGTEHYRDIRAFRTSYYRPRQGNRGRPRSGQGW